MLENVAYFFSILGSIGNFLVGLGVIFGSWVAWKGWKQEVRGQSEYTLAISLLANTYLYRDALSAVRDPFMSGAEMTPDEGEKKPNVNYERPSREGTAFAYQNRWNKLIKAHQRLYEGLQKAEAIWGEEVTKLFSNYFTHRVMLRVVIFKHLRFLDGTEHRDLSEEQFKILYTHDEDDPFGDESKRLLEEIEDFLKPKLKA